MNKRKMGIVLLTLVLAMSVLTSVHAMPSYRRIWNTDLYNKKTGLSGTSDLVWDILLRYGVTIPKYIYIEYLTLGKNYSANGWWVYVAYDLSDVDHNLKMPEPKIHDGSRIAMEDGLMQGYLRQGNHVLLIVRVKPKMLTYITVLIISDYGTYFKTFRTRASSICIYFTPERFISSYTITLLAQNGLGTYIPDSTFTG